MKIIDMGDCLIDLDSVQAVFEYGAVVSGCQVKLTNFSAITLKKALRGRALEKEKEREEILKKVHVFVNFLINSAEKSDLCTQSLTGETCKDCKCSI